MAGTVLVVNAGSASLKLRLLDARDEIAAELDVEGSEGWEEALERFVGEAPAADAAGHRVVHGGEEFPGAVHVSADFERRMEPLRELAPLHNPPALRMIEALRRLRPQMPSIACFDTAFHRTLSAAASTYALPAGWNERWPLRRFGFHGLSHAYASRRAAELLGRESSELRLVTAHLGAGASLAAVTGGRSVDTTMGFTPLEGLVMATRSGGVDPGLLLWVQRQADLAPTQAEDALEHEAGLLGLSKRSGSLKEVLAAAAEGDERCDLAVEVYLHRLRAGIAAMAAAMDGLDGLVFTGGAGERSAEIRARACEGLGFLGIELDPKRNEAADEADTLLSETAAKGKVLVVKAREDLEVAAQVRALLAA